MPKLRLDERRVRVLMAMNGIGSLPDLATKAKMNYSTVYKMVSTGKFSIESVETIATALGCNPIDLVTTDGFPDPKSVALAVR